MLESIRYMITNSTVICAENGFRDLFINNCREKNIKLRDISINDSKLYFMINDKNLKAVNDIGINAGMTITVIKNYSLKSFIKNYNARIGLPVGMACGILLFWFLSGFLWSIEISGLNTIDTEDFVSQLEKASIKKGIRLSSVDCNEIERYCESLSSNVLQVTVNLIGCKLYIHVHERALPQTPEEFLYGNIIAKKSGRIVKINVFAGVPLVKEGDPVCKGDTLVGGIQPLSDGALRYSEAKADVIAETQTAIRVVQNNVIKGERLEKIHTRFALEIFGIRIPFYKETVLPSYSYLSTRQSLLPVALISERIAYTVPDETEIDSRQQLLFVLSSLGDEIIGLSPDAEYAGFTIVNAEDNVSFDTVITCIESVAQTVYFDSISK